MFSRNSLIGLFVALALSAGYAWLSSKLLKDATDPAAEQQTSEPQPDAKPRWLRNLFTTQPTTEAFNGHVRESVTSSDGFHCD